jgi:tRNA(fMet)-specific endonuclease VapC
LSEYLLDTNVMFEMARNPGGRVARRAEPVRNRCVTSIIVLAELRYGLIKRGSNALATQVRLVMEAIPALPWEAPADACYARLRLMLEATGTPIGANDMLIAAHALALDATLVTANEREFRRVPGLMVENWAS